MFKARMTWLDFAVLVGVLLGVPAGASATMQEGAVTTEQLVYQGAEVKVQVDVNGEAAIELLGSALDAMAVAAEEQAEALRSGGCEGEPQAGPAAMLSMAEPAIGPAKEALKSLTRATVLVMKPKGAVSGEDFVEYYEGVMAPRGWWPLMTVRAEAGVTVTTMLAPEGKGLFLAVNEKSNMVVGLVTTSRPIGDLIGQVVRASGRVLPTLIMQRGRAPKAPVAQEKPAEPEEKAK